MYVCGIINVDLKNVYAFSVGLFMLIFEFFIYVLCVYSNFIVLYCIVLYMDECSFIESYPRLQVARVLMPGAASLVLTIPTSTILCIRLKRLYCVYLCIHVFMYVYLPTYLCIYGSLLVYFY